MEPVTDPTRLNDNLNYPGLFDAISDAGIVIEQRFPGGVWWCSNAAATQAIINSYDPVPYARKVKKLEVRAEALVRVNQLYPSIQSADDLDLEFDRWGSIKATAKAANASYQKLLDIRTARQDAVQAINAATTVAQIRAIVPAWPV